nr:helix-turn-helix transcriptional regulator [uncultured Draconibacterium sp.]
MNKNKVNLDLVPIGPLLKEIADEKNLSAVVIGEKIGKSKQAVYDIYKKTKIDSELVALFSHILGVPVQSLIKEKNVIEEDNPIIIDPDNSAVMYLTEKLEKMAIEVGELRKEREHIVIENKTLKQEVNELKGIKKYSIDLPQPNVAEPKLNK